MLNFDKTVAAKNLFHSLLYRLALRNCTKSVKRLLIDESSGIFNFAVWPRRWTIVAQSTVEPGYNVMKGTEYFVSL